MPFHAVAIGILLSCWPFLSGAEAPQPSTAGVVLTAAATEVPLVPRAKIAKDTDNRLSAEDLLQAQARAVPHDGNEIVGFGFSDATYWFSVSIENADAAPLQRLLVFEPTWLDDVQVTLVQPDGARRTYAGGDALAFGHRAVAHRQINFDLTLPPGRSQLVVRTRTQDPFLVGMTLWERSAFFRSDNREALYFGLVYGAMGALLLFNLFLFFSVRETIYAAYVAYLLSFLVSNATYNGHLYPLLWPDSPVWGNWAHSITIYLFMLAGLHFTSHFLELRIRLVRAWRWARGFALAILASLAATALAGYGLHVSSSILWVVVYSPFVLLLGVLSFRAGNRAARYFLTATAAGFIGSFITASTVSGFIPFSFFSYRAAEFGMLVDAVLLSLALADRLRLSRAEADLAKAELIEAGRTYARQLEEQVAQRTRELSQANAIKDKFFAIVAHDLRGPIGGLASLFNEAVTSADDLTDELLDIVRATTLSTKHFLEELLTWARSQRGEIDCRPVAFDMRVMLKETGELYSAQAQAKDVRLSVDGAEGCWVCADLAMTHTVLRNLMHNALKFTAGGGSIRASVKRDAGRCMVSIGDSGVGMSRETLESIFRLDVKPQSSPGTRDEQGTGLGLILCKEFVEKNGGAIGARSEPGLGSTFWFTLPNAKESEIVDPRAMQEKARSLRILLAEDDKLHRDASARVLRDWGCSLVFAADGDEAVRLASAHDFDLILMDIDMPRVDGIEATRRIRADGSRSRIVSLSSYSRQELNQLTRDVPFDEYLYKPLTRDDAIILITTCLLGDSH